METIKTEQPLSYSTINTLFSNFNQFLITSSHSDPCIPKTFMCNSITIQDIPDWHSTEISFNRRFLSPIVFNSETVSVIMKVIDNDLMSIKLNLCTGAHSDVITINASHDHTIFVPTEPCQMNDSHINSKNMIDYLMNPDFYDPNKICHQDGLYVIDPNRLGVMTKRQEYIFESFMRLELERDCYHDVLKTVCFVVKDWEVSVGIFNLEGDWVEEMHEVEEEILEAVK